MYDREHILFIGGGGGVGGGRDACAKSTHELAGSSLFTEDGDVVPLRVGAAASWGAEGRGGGATEVPKLAHLDMEQLRMPTMRPAFDRYTRVYICKCVAHVCVCVCVCMCVSVCVCVCVCIYLYMYTHVYRMRMLCTFTRRMMYALVLLQVCARQSTRVVR